MRSLGLVFALFLVTSLGAQENTQWVVKNSDPSKSLWILFSKEPENQEISTFTHRQWAEILENGKLPIILLPGESAQGNWSNDNLMIGAFSSGSASDPVGGYLRKDDFPAEAISLDLEYWEGVHLRRGDTLSQALEIWNDPSLALDGSSLDWINLIYSEFSLEGPIVNLKTFDQEGWKNLLMEIQEGDELPRSIVLGAYLGEQTFFSLEFPLIDSNPGVFLWVSGNEPLKIGSMAFGEDFVEASIHWETLERQIEELADLTFSMYLIRGVGENLTKTEKFSLQGAI